VLCVVLSDTVADGYVSKDSQLSASDNVLIRHDVGPPVHLSHGMCLTFYIHVVFAVVIYCCSYLGCLLLCSLMGTGYWFLIHLWFVELGLVINSKKYTNKCASLLSAVTARIALASEGF